MPRDRPTCKSGPTDEAHRGAEGLRSRESDEVQAGDSPRLEMRRQARCSVDDLDVVAQLGSQELEPVDCHAISRAGDDAIDYHLLFVAARFEGEAEPPARVGSPYDPSVQMQRDGRFDAVAEPSGSRRRRAGLGWGCKWAS